MSSSQQREEEQQSVSSSSSQVHLHGGQEGANTQLTDDEQQRAVEALLPSPPRTPDGTLGAAQSNVDGTVRSYHFPSQPNASASSRSSPPRASPLHTTVTVADLRTKSCWICSEEDEDRPTFAQSSSSAEGLPGTQRRETPVRGRRRFVHPCRCTLVAHESCLLAWIDQSRANRPLLDTVRCPQCQAPYILIERKPIALRFFEFVDRAVTRAIPVGTAGALGTAILVASTAYGCVAIRLFLGPAAARRTLASPWPWHFWIDIPLIPFALIAGRLRIFDRFMTWLPTLVAFPVTHIPLTTGHWRLMHRYIDGTGVNARRFPPSPALTILLVPWVRVAYMALKRRIYRAVLHPLLGKPPDTRESRDHRRRRVIVVGEDNHLVDADPPPGADAVEEGPGEGEGGEAQQTIYVTHQSLGRLILGALSLPVIANGAGAALGYAARWSTTLSRILGIGTSAAGLPVLAHYPLKSPLASLFSGDWLSPGTGGTASRGSGSSFASWLHDSSLPTSYDDLDPIWWRNALGAGLFIIGRDALALLFRWMRLRQRRRTRIADLPFEQGLVAGLDLRL